MEAHTAEDAVIGTLAAMPRPVAEGVPAPADGLIGRRREQRRLAELIEGVRQGRGGSLLIEGPPGVGKTALLRDASDDGVRALLAIGVEREVDLPFAALADLLEPVLELAEELPAPQRDAIRGALAAADPGGHDRVQVLHATVALLRLAAEREPLVVAVDDVQWLDPSSRGAVAFVARRADRIGAAVLVVRSLRGEPAEPWPDVPTLTLDELGRGDALLLARRQGVSAPVAEALVDVLGGNPLALTEAPVQLTDDQRRGRTSLPAALPTGERLTRGYQRRIAALPESARRALLLVAAGGGEHPRALAAALATATPSTVLGPAEDAGLIVVTASGIRFSHPTIRAAAYHGAPAGERRAAHRALADGLDGGARAWQLAAAAEAPDEELAAALERLGHEAAARGAPETASAVFERAAALSPSDGAATARMVAAAGAALVAGRPATALGVLDRMAPVADPATRADVQLLRGMAIQQSGRPMAAYALLEDEAERVLAHDPGRAAGLLMQAGIALVAHGPMERLGALAERTLALAPPGADLVPAIFAASALTSLGDHARARTTLRERTAALEAFDPTGPAHEVLAVAALCFLWMEDLDDADRLASRLVRTSLERGAVTSLARARSVLANVRLRQGAFAEAAVLADQAVGLGEDSAGGFLHSMLLTTAAFTAAHVGDDAAVAAHAGRALELGLELGLTSTLACAEQALGVVALSRGDASLALPHLERALEHQRRFGSRDPSFLYTQADLAEAYARTGRPDAARTLIAELVDGAERTGGAWAEAAAARCAALIDGDERLDEHAAAALAAHDRVALPFERARTQLCLGERLRRARRRVDARLQLEAARASFAAFGAAHWVVRAEQELAAAGRPVEGAATGADDLTAREREVCDLVAGGATNREVAAALFLSPRTVEHHLRGAYRKLGVRSRSELARRWAAS